MTVGDEELIARIRGGDGGAFEALFNRYAPLLRRRVGRRMPPPLQRKCSVSDILQETRIAALEAIGDFEYRGPGSVRRWLDRIAEMRVRSVVNRFRATAKRALGREVSRNGRAETGQFAARGPSPSEAAIGAETAERIRAALDRLRPDDRAVLLLVREEHLTLAEAAERLGRSREATKKLYARALERFTKVFQGPSDD